MIDQERQNRAKEYARLRHRLMALDLIISALAFILVLATGLSMWARDVVLGITTNTFLSTEIYFAVGLLAYGVLFAPLTYYSGFVLPHRYGISVQSFQSWLMDLFKGGALSFVLGSLVIQVIYFLLNAVPNLWWLITAAF